jgi:PAS domain S-box-containing protein
MKQPLRVLIAEDNPADAELILLELRCAGYDPEWELVNTEVEYLDRLRPDLDIILSDYEIPQFCGLRALELLQESGLDVPFIIISGTIGEELAVAVMKLGASDYLLKDRLKRLGPAVNHVIADTQLRRERRRLGEQLLLHSTAVEAADNAILMTDRNGAIIWVNAAFTALTGYTADEVLGKTPRVLKSGKHDQSFYRNLWKTILAGQTWRGEFTNHRKDGSVFYDALTITPVRSGGGLITHYIGIMHDLTERRQAEEELRTMHADLHQLLAHSPAVIYRLKIDGQTVTPLVVSDNIERLLGVSVVESTASKWWLDSLHPDDRERVAGVMAQSLTGNGYSMEYRIRHKDGSYHWVEDNSRMIHGPNGDATDAVGVWTDVTERKRTEERLREQADMLDRAQDAIIAYDFESRMITFWNNGAERLYGWNAEEAIGWPNDERLYADVQGRKESLKILSSNGEFRGELKQVTKDGHEMIVDARVTLVRNEDGTPRSVLCINTDITDQKKLETHLLRAQRLESIGTLASGVAHDLNNILTPILVCAETLRGDMTAEDRESAIALIEESAERGANVVKQVLTFARGVEGERVSIKPSHLVQEMVDIAQKTFPKSIEITSRFPGDLWSIKGDPTQLHQVLLNISVNARDAMPAGGKLALVSENFSVDEQYAAMTPEATPGSYVLLQISDTGSGMSRETIDKIFDPFFTTKELGDGTGLGLSTTVGIVKSHGGFISVQSEIGKGTVFQIFFPADLSGLSSLSSKPRVALAEGNGELVLVVDDEENILRVTKMILEQHNYRVISASDGAEAVALFAEQMQTIGVVLTDIAMPHMDGVAAIRALRKMKPDVPIVAFSGEAQRARFEELQAMKVNNFLIKPFTAANLLAALHTSIGRTDRVEAEMKAT